MTAGPPRMQRTSWIDRRLNRLLDVLAARGIGPAYVYRLEVIGRTTGRRYSTPVNLTRGDGRRVARFVHHWVWLDTQAGRRVALSPEVQHQLLAG